MCVYVCVLDSFYLCVFHLLAFIWLTERNEERCLSALNPVTHCDVTCYGPQSARWCVYVCFYAHVLYVSLNLALPSLPSITWDACLLCVLVEEEGGGEACH